MSWIPISVGSNFKVKVTGYDGPVKGLLLKVEGASAITDGNGIAEFHSVSLGTHYLRAIPDNGYGDQLEVTRNGPKNTVVPMRWPSVKPIRVRSLSGTMLGQRVLSVDLLDGVSGRVLSSISTTERGEFDFGKQVPGLYFIRVVGGLISVAVDPGAPAEDDKLRLSLSWTSCGLMYMNLRQCPQSDLHVKKLEGHVNDPGGLPVPGAEIVLLDPAQNQVGQLSADSHGDFSSPDPLSGPFELWASVAGFNLVHTTLHIEPTAPNATLVIDAAYGEICSSVWAK